MNWTELVWTGLVTGMDWSLNWTGQSLNWNGHWTELKWTSHWLGDFFCWPNSNFFAISCLDMLFGMQKNYDGFKTRYHPIIAHTYKYLAKFIGGNMDKLVILPQNFLVFEHSGKVSYRPPIFLPFLGS